jgi:hypothetical protein
MRHGVAIALARARAATYAAAGDLSGADRYAGEALEVAEQFGLPLDAATVLIAQAGWLAAAGDHGASDDRRRRAAELLERHGAVPRWAHAVAPTEAHTNR